MLFLADSEKEILNYVQKFPLRCPKKIEVKLYFFIWKGPDEVARGVAKKAESKGGFKKHLPIIEPFPKKRESFGTIDDFISF